MSDDGAGRESADGGGAGGKIQPQGERFYMDVFAIARRCALRATDPVTASEIAETVALALWEECRTGGAGWQPPADLEQHADAFVRKTLANRYRSERRRAGRQFRYAESLEVTDHSWMNVHQIAENNAFWEAVGRAAEQLPRKRREVFKRVCEPGASYSAIANETGDSEAAIRNNFHRALLSIRKAANFEYWRDDK